MNLFYNKKSDVLERRLKSCVDSFCKFIKQDKKLKSYVKVFGLTGTAARGQASSRGSDIDFYAITNYLSPKKEKYLRNRFGYFFKNIGFDVDILVFAPSIFKRPDLMLFEFVNSGKIFYGSLDCKLDINQVPKWEGIRLLTFKGDPFLASFDKERQEKEYYYSKLLLGIGEAFLLLDNTYIADNMKRYNLVLKNKYCNSITSFIDEYKLAHKYRYEDYSFKLNDEELKKKGLELLQLSWRLYLEIYMKTDYDGALLLLKKIKPLTIREKIGSRIFFTIHYWNFFKKIRFLFFREPFIKELLMIQDYLRTQDNSLRKKIIEYWKAAPRFWYNK